MKLKNFFIQGPVNLIYAVHRPQLIGTVVKLNTFEEVSRAGKKMRARGSGRQEGRLLEIFEFA
jgi:hypothetical protein